MENIEIKYVSLFAGLNAEQLDRIWRVSVLQKYKKNKMIVFEEEPDTRLYIILKGLVKLTRLSEEGREVIFSFLGEGDVFGEL